MYNALEIKKQIMEDYLKTSNVNHAEALLPINAICDLLNSEEKYEIYISNKHIDFSTAFELLNKLENFKSDKLTNVALKAKDNKDKLYAFIFDINDIDFLIKELRFCIDIPNLLCIAIETEDKYSNKYIPLFLNRYNRQIIQPYRRYYAFRGEGFGLNEKEEPDKYIFPLTQQLFDTWLHNITIIENEREERIKANIENYKLEKLKYELFQKEAELESIRLNNLWYKKLFRKLKSLFIKENLNVETSEAQAPQGSETPQESQEAKEDKETKESETT